MTQGERNGEALKKLLKAWNDTYEQGHPIVSDKEYDDVYFELAQLEASGNTPITSDSPTQSVQYDFVTALQKVAHNHKMLSLDKTKNIADVKTFLGNHPYLAMAKMDGLTCSLRYLDGKLVSAETRGNGIIGEDVTHNAKIIDSIPQTISYKEELIVDGEIICKVNDFASFSSLYSTPRNFAAGSIRLLDASECKQRNLTFVAWDVIKGFEDKTQLSSKLWELMDCGFITVPTVSAIGTDDLDEDIDFIKSTSADYFFPIDGVVFKFNDVAYGKSLGETAHHFKNAIAYKFYDEKYESTLQDIDWTMGRTGVLTPVAIYADIDIDGTICNRASLHNVSIMEQTIGLLPYKGEKIWVCKQNMIIPQIVRADYHPIDIPLGDTLVPPQECPICGKSTEIKISDGSVKELYCTNPDCPGKLINKLDHFCGKKGLDIKGLSKATLEKLIDWGWVTNAADIFNLSTYRDEWIKQDGFGEKSVDNILNAIETSRTCSLDSFIAALGIPLIGRTVAKDLIKHIDSYLEFKELIDMRYDFSTIDGFGTAKCQALWNYDYTIADQLSEILNIQKPTVIQVDTSNSLAGKTIVITGKLHNYKNRAELQAVIEARGGKVASSVSKATTCLINNDNTSQSAKNLGAKKLGIPILTEDEFIFTYLTN